MYKFLSHNKSDFVFLFFLLPTLPLFFYKLGDSSLVSFDEAWYAEIARNIVKTGDIFNLIWNGNLYQDHPPAGFWLMALVFKIFGVSEFLARFVPAISGFFSVIVTYFLGKQFFNRYVGLASGIALTSATWFLFRARSGNLDTILAMLFLLSIFLALKASTDKRYLIPLSISLVMLFLTKSLVPFTIIPVLLVIFYHSQILKKLRMTDLIVSVGIFVLPITVWLIMQIIQEPAFLQHYLKIGFPGRDVGTPINDALALYKQYLHNGIGKWFWPGILGLIGGVVLFRKKGFLVLATFFVSFSLPFLFSREGHIWHLIPLYPFMLLGCFGFGYVTIEKLTKKKFLATVAIFLFGLYFWFPQIKVNWQQFVGVNAFVSDEAILSLEASKYPQRLYIDGDFYPVAVFYSEKNVQQIWFGALPIIFAETEPFLLITKQERLDGAKIPKVNYKVLKTDRDRILILKD